MVVVADNTAAAARNKRAHPAAEQKEAARREVPGEANTVVRSLGWDSGKWTCDL